MLRMVSHPRRPQSGHIMCYLNRTYHVLPTNGKINTCSKSGAVLLLSLTTGFSNERAGKNAGWNLATIFKSRDSKKLPVLIQNFRPRICYVLSLLRIHSPDCEHCMARQTCGDELRKRLEELDGRKQPSSHENGNHRDFPRAG